MKCLNNIAHDLLVTLHGRSGLQTTFHEHARRYARGDTAGHISAFQFYVGLFHGYRITFTGLAKPDQGRIGHILKFSINDSCVIWSLLATTPLQKQYQQDRQ